MEADKTILQETTAEVVRLSTRKHQDWVDEAGMEIQELLKNKCSCHNFLLAKPDDQAAKAAYKTACSTLQAKLRTMQNDWWTAFAEMTQHYGDKGDMHALYEALKAVHGPSHQIQAPLRSLDGTTLLTDKEAILQHWSKHFKGLLSFQHTLEESSLAKIPQVDVKLESVDPPTQEEIKKATMQLKVGRSPGTDGIPAEVYQCGEEAVLDLLQDVFTNWWEKGTVLQDLRDAVTVSLYKNKGAKIRLFKLSRHYPTLHCRQNLGSHLAEWAHPNNSTGKHARKPVWVQVQQRDSRHDLHAEADTEEIQRTEHSFICAFIDMTKAFDTVNHDGL